MIIEDDSEEKNFDIEEFFDLNSNPRLRSNSRNSAGVVFHDEMEAEYKWSISDCHPAFPPSWLITYIIYIYIYIYIYYD